MSSGDRDEREESLAVIERWTAKCAASAKGGATPVLRDRVAALLAACWAFERCYGETIELPPEVLALERRGPGR